MVYDDLLHGQSAGNQPDLTHGRYSGNQPSLVPGNQSGGIWDEEIYK